MLFKFIASLRTKCICSESSSSLSWGSTSCCSYSSSSSIGLLCLISFSRVSTIELLKSSTSVFSYIIERAFWIYSTRCSSLSTPYIVFLLVWYFLVTSNSNFRLTIPTSSESSSNLIRRSSRDLMHWANLSLSMYYFSSCSISSTPTTLAKIARPVPFERSVVPFLEFFPRCH